MHSKTKAIHHHLLEQARQKRKLTAGTAQLTYYIFEGVLVGFVESDIVYASAWSGGAGGSTRHSTDRSANNPYMYALKEVDDKKKRLHVHGGPIPPGAYQVYTPGRHAKLGLSARLEPLQPLPNNRGGFYIHSEGPHGSDGCIVLRNDECNGLMEKLKASKGGRLVVCEAMEGAFA